LPSAVYPVFIKTPQLVLELVCFWIRVIQGSKFETDDVIFVAGFNSVDFTDASAEIDGFIEYLQVS